MYARTNHLLNFLLNDNGAFGKFICIARPTRKVSRYRLNYCRLPFNYLIHTRDISLIRVDRHEQNTVQVLAILTMRQAHEYLLESHS